ncbi:hypothetical protein BO70DRAFT_407337 [Aspergillus heteromorphus CBS 117.55]|uniref:Uncharacterized protein n=1 Tax=Aspergillus heteromorphus CBS 117.55 TaxID=1448321 RepID=A0A317W389_9EURO|nr:uncharacterized protein BO70DRAFT_407337 [Aspergillus heteromorphus CBS 117.55]PWY79742.1 hypothetical protein BO70DRAFT_407337 [Aspergillus heteromorphus CBS 117.55]
MHFRQSQKRNLDYTLSFIACVLSIYILKQSIRPILDGSWCNSIFYSWSPAENILSYEWTTFNNTPFFTEDAFFKLDLTADLEQAWADFLPRHPIAIPISRLKDLKHSDNLRLAQPFPTNNDQVIALPEVFVQLHCLHFLWQYSHRQEYNYTNLLGSSEEQLKRRTDQCVERLRQAIMCWADPGVYTKLRVHGGGGSSQLGVDLDTIHRCRNFEDIRQWTIENGVSTIRMLDGWWNVTMSSG